MNEFTAILAAVVLGAIIAVSAVGNGVVPTAERIFDNRADFSAKFVRP